ncbi:hypothetical protein BU25DRAFT_265541 [Macroventuria anomochaeta]|uniref:Uncharacterized protein n=1 Tax=Macroventuria anomochaeta TaxID=301207 RepID=A0ACB6S7R8_9PLEO|nr:uncharacterized protein BU25DRAFT_265541 [Macroventuria anomochaeta]KAF2630093.1 hypothetical protein BU25DRAFT_265541 [Macroventuria anomochaeta]
MRGSNGESLDNAVDHITLQLGRVWSASKRQNEDLEKATSRISLLEKEFEKKQAEWNRKQTEAQSLESTLKILEKELKEARANINRNYEIFQKDRKSLEKKIQKLVSENQSLQSKDSDRKRLKESYEKLLREAKDVAAAEKRRASQQQESHRTNYNNHVKSMNDRIALLERQNEKLKDDLYDAGLKTGKTVKDLKAKLSKAELDAEKEKQKLQEQLEAQEARLKKQHQANTQQLRSVNEEFRSALVAREHFKGLRDRDITKKFTGLATEIEDISTLGWNSNNSVDWPLSENQLRQIHPSNIRLLKQQVVQSCIWMLLHKHVFGSPFRIMGTEGQQADGTWRNIYCTGEFCSGRT